MNFDRNTLIGIGAAALLVLGGLGYWAFGSGGSKETAQAPGDCKPIDTYEVSDADHTLGKADAPITFIEYASMTCPHCARFTRDVYPKLKEEYIDKGYVRYVFREFPLDRVALTVSVVGRCLQKDAYIPFIELMYGELETWGRAEDPRAAIKEMARRAGMSGDDFEKCLSTEDDAKRVIAVQEKGVKDYCVAGTPTFLVNGKVIASGEIAWETLDEKLRAAAKDKGVTIPAAAAATPAPAEGAATTTEGTTAAPAEGAATAPAAGTATPASGAASTPAEGTAKPAETTPPAAATPSEPAKTPPAH